ncbi:hypothetical protein FACS189419_07560 [Planctomycetales bacterium]|nr:hypothetical protein FACS189419_07560 [Planctomycetales bacterium]
MQPEFEMAHPLPAELEPVLKIAFRHLPPQDAAVRIASIIQQFEAGNINLNGIFLAKTGNACISAMYAQRRPDGSVMLWLPSMPEGYSPAPFYKELEKYCLNEKTFAAVALADRNQPFDETTLREAGQFEFLSDLVYLGVQLSPSDARFDPQRLTFIPVSEIQEMPTDRLAKLTAETYKNSLDFPKLMQIAPVEAVLEGYQFGTLYRPELWFIVQENGNDAGVLLLTDASPEQAELTYMGLLNEIRGKGYAGEMVAFAKAVAARQNKVLLLTAADAQNIPACQSYLSHGFKAWDRKKVFARFYP